MPYFNDGKVLNISRCLTRLNEEKYLRTFVYGQKIRVPTVNNSNNDRVDDEDGPHGKTNLDSGQVLIRHKYLNQQSSMLARMTVKPQLRIWYHKKIIHILTSLACSLDKGLQEYNFFYSRKMVLYTESRSHRSGSSSFQEFKSTILSALTLISQCYGKSRRPWGERSQHFAVFVFSAFGSSKGY